MVSLLFPTSEEIEAQITWLVFIHTSLISGMKKVNIFLCGSGINL